MSLIIRLTVLSDLLVNVLDPRLTLWERNVTKFQPYLDLSFPWLTWQFLNTAKLSTPSLTSGRSQKFPWGGALSELHGTQSWFCNMHDKATETALNPDFSTKDLDMRGKTDKKHKSHAVCTNTLHRIACVSEKTTETAMVDKLQAHSWQQA